MRNKKQKKPEYIEKQVSSGKMTINQARVAIGLKKHEDNGKSDKYIMSEKFYSNTVKHL